MMKQWISACLVVALLVTMLCSVAVLPTTAATVSPTIMGDLDGNNDMNSTDIRMYLKKLAKQQSFTGREQTVGDVDNDGDYSTTDVRAMLTMILNSKSSTPVRAFWVAYFEVNSLLNSGNVATAKSKIDACLQDCANRGTNVVYFHVRANSDAYYPSKYFNLNSSAKAVINAGFDPLAYAIESAHAKGMELHAWVNPYRIGSSTSFAKVSAYFQKGSTYYYVPSDPAVQQLVVNGVRELVENYDIDGVQFDDYFYPEGKMLETGPETFEQSSYNATSNGMSIGDWRRNAVNQLLSACYQVCHSREGCVFGISPAGDRNKTYTKMYADPAYWLRTPGYIDYLAPQLYFGFNNAASPFEGLLKDWQAQPRLETVDMIAGLGLYKTGLKEDTWAGTSGKYEWANNSNIMSRQVEMTYAYEWNGVAMYAHASLTDFTDRNQSVATADMNSGCEAWMIFN